MFYKSKSNNSLLIVIITILICLLPTFANTKKADKKADTNKPKKNILDYNDADMERLFDQWEENEEPLAADELPEHLRPPPDIDMEKVDMSNPENLLKMTKKGRTLMTFVKVSGNPTKDETEDITKIWQTGLWNNHIQAERYMIDSNRAIFMFKDGAQAWESKDFLVNQERCESVTIENKVYNGKNFADKDEL